MATDSWSKSAKVLEQVREQLESKLALEEGEKETRKIGKVYVEITKGKHAWSAWVVSKAGKRGAPLSIGEPRTFDDAFARAAAAIKKIG